MSTWRVCKITEEGTMKSFSVDHPDLELEYRMNEWTEAHIGGVLCFSSLEYAIRFLAGFDPSPFAILRCIGEKPLTLPHGAPLIFYHQDQIKIAKAAWSGQDVHREVQVDFWPDGTVAYRRVMPIDIVR